MSLKLFRTLMVCHFKRGTNAVNHLNTILIVKFNRAVSIQIYVYILFLLVQY